MFESLSEKLEAALKSVKGEGRINELNIAETMREVRRALLDADVNYQVARDFTNRVKEKALNEGVLTAVSPGQLFVMGDNRDNSQDNRYWGFVRREKIRGKAFLIYWSWNGDGHWLRWRRLGHYLP